MKKTTLPILSAAIISGVVCSADVPAVPVIAEDSVSLSQSKATDLVTINYRLEGAPAIITVDIQTNGVSIGGENIWYMKGDVHKLVAEGDRKIFWRSGKAWPGHKIADGVTAVVTAWATNTPPDYMVVDLEAARSVNFYAREEELPDGVGHRRYKTTKLVMRKIPAGGVQWRAGRRSTDVNTGYNGYKGVDHVAHLVTLDDDYYMGVYELTQRQYELMMVKQSDATKIKHVENTKPDYEVLPIKSVSINHYLRGQAGLGYNWPVNGHSVSNTFFFGLLRTHAGFGQFDLPTEHQWEFACRAGSGEMFHNDYNIPKSWEWNEKNERIYEIANCKNNGIGKAQEVGLLVPNKWGLYDMSGNVCEWCLDWYNDSPIGFDPERGPESGTEKVVRGGSFASYVYECRTTFRHKIGGSAEFDFVGCRVCCPAALDITL